jgi:hypothetical protein
MKIANILIELYRFGGSLAWIKSGKYEAWIEFKSINKNELLLIILNRVLTFLSLSNCPINKSKFDI